MSTPKPNPALARILYTRMFEAAGGSRNWWPADRSTPDHGRGEIIIGAVLTQNTNWSNVEKALTSLRAAGCCDLRKLAVMPPEDIAPLIKSAGYFNLKARRLRAVAEFFAPGGRSRFAAIARIPTPELREQLLAVYGVGRETADSILLYALDRLSFVIDAYTLRIGTRHGLFPESTTYEAARAFFADSLASQCAGLTPAAQLALYNEYHALLVFIGARYCKPTPRCATCPLAHRDCCASTESWLQIKDRK